MKTILVSLFALALIPGRVYAVDGQILINQATVAAAGGYPYKITQPGSYKLSGNLAGVGDAKDAIDINSDHVTLDLNGFMISGPVGGASHCYFCVGVNSTYAGITVKNGVISGFSTGIRLTGAGNLVQDVQTDHNAGDGLDVNNGTVTRCSATSSYNGFSVTNTVLSDSTATNNGNIGISATGSTVIRNAVTGNGTGIQTQSSTVVGSNSVHDNFFADLDLASGSVSQNNNVCSSGPC